MRMPVALLACPTCKGPLQTDPAGLRCDRCRASYPPAGSGWDLRSPRFRGGTVHGRWDLDPFSRAYEKLGDYESSAERSRRTGVPEIVEEYRYPRIKGRLLDWVGQTDSPAAVLDIGCGVGQFLLEVRERLDPVPGILAGIDVVPSRVSHAQGKFAGRPECLAVLASAEELPFPARQFDVVTCTEVMEHVARPERAFQEIRRVLRPGGMLCFSSPNRTATILWERIFTIPRIVRRLARGTIRQSREEPYDVPLGHHRLLRLFRRSGLVIDRFHRSVFLPHESYYQFLPPWMNRWLVAAGSFLERRAPVLSPWMGLHYVVRARRLP